MNSPDDGTKPAVLPAESILNSKSAGNDKHLARRIFLIGTLQFMVFLSGIAALLGIVHLALADQWQWVLLLPVPPACVQILWFWVPIIRILGLWPAYPNAKTMP